MKYNNSHLRKIITVICTFLFTPLVIFSQDCARVDFVYEINESIAIFSGVSDSEVSSWSWDFGDNSIGSGQKVRRQYNNHGAYDVCLDVKVNDDCSAKVCKKIRIGLSSNECDLKVDFDFKSDGNLGYFFAKSNDQTANYYWNVAGLNTEYKGKEIRIPFEKAGTYEVCVIAVNIAETCKARTCKQIKINTEACTLEADFEFSVDKNIVKLSAKSTVGPNAKYTWNTGDGNRAEGQQARHEYKNRGIYEICLTVIAGQLTTTSNQSCNKTVCKKVTIGDIKVTECDFKADFAYSVAGNVVTLKGRSNDENASFQWYNHLTRENISGKAIRMQFDQAGVYEICMIAVNADKNCKEHLCKQISIGSKIKVYPNPTSDYIYITSDKKVIEYAIYDRANLLQLEGAVISEHFQIDIIPLRDDVYYIKMKFDDSSTLTQRFYKLSAK